MHLMKAKCETENNLPSARLIVLTTPENHLSEEDGYLRLLTTSLLR